MTSAIIFPVVCFVFTTKTRVFVFHIIHLITKEIPISSSQSGKIPTIEAKDIFSTILRSPLILAGSFSGLCHLEGFFLPQKKSPRDLHN